MRSFSCQLLSLSIVFAAFLSASARDLHVAIDGDDANPGTEERPLASIAKAVASLRDEGPGTIWVGPGEYCLEEGLEFDAGHAGTAERPLVLRGTEPGAVRLSGARTVNDFRPITPDEARLLIFGI